MPMKTRYPVVVLLAATLVLAGCASRPDEELEAAKAAIAEARNTSNADVWAPDEFEAAQRALETAEREIAAQDDTFAGSRSYDKARESLIQAAALADAAATTAEANRTAARQSAHDRLRAAELAIDRARDAVMGAPETKDTRADITLHSQDLDRLSDSLVEVEDLLAVKDYKGANDRADAITRSAESITKTMLEATARYEGR